MKTVVACVDFSEVTSAVLEAAAALCGALEAELNLLHIVSCTDGAGMGALPLVGDPEARIREAQERLDGLVEPIRHHGLEVSARVKKWIGSPASAILADAERRRPDFIVLGSHGHGPLFNILLGNTAEGVLRKAECPVLLVPSRKVENRDMFGKVNTTGTATP